MEILSGGRSMRQLYLFSLIFAHFDLSAENTFIFLSLWAIAQCAIWQRVAGNIKYLFAFA